MLVSCGEDGTIQQQFYQLQTNVENKVFQHSASVQSLIYDIDIDIVLAFDREGNILVLNFSTLILIKKIISYAQQVFMPYVDFNNNLLIGFSGKNTIIYDYSSILRDYHINFINKIASINSFATNKKEDQVIFSRNDGYLQLWNTNSYFIEHLTYLPNKNEFSSIIYYFEEEQLLVIIKNQAVFLYDFQERKIIQTDQQGCDKSYIFQKQIIICIHTSTYSRISIQHDKDRIFTLEIVEKNDQIKGVISLLSSQNNNIFAYCSTGTNDLYIFDPIKNKLIKHILSHHDTKIISLQVQDKYIITFDIKGIIKLVYGDNFDKVQKIEDYKDLRVYNIITQSENLIYVKQSSSITPFKININIDKNIIITKGEAFQISCSGRSSKFYKNSKDVIIIICSNDLIYIFKIIDDSNNVLKFEQIDLVRINMLQSSRFQYSFFLTDFIFALEYQKKQIFLFLDDNFTFTKSYSNPAPDNGDFYLISLQQESYDKVKLVYYDIVSLKKQTWPQLIQMSKYSEQQQSCQFEASFISGIEASNHLKQISKSYSDFSQYLNIKNFNIILNISFSHKLDYTLEFEYKNNANLMIKGIEKGQNSIIQATLSKEFIQDCQLFNSFQLENLVINQDEIDKALEFNNFKRLKFINIIFQDVVSQRYIFNKPDFLLIQNLQINHIKQSRSTSQPINSSQVQIFNAKEVQIDQLQFTNCTLIYGKNVSIFKIQNSDSVTLSKLNLKHNDLYTTHLFEITQVQALQFINSTINDNKIENKQNYANDIMLNLFSLQYINNTTIEGIEFSKNQDITFIEYQNFIEILVNGDYVTIKNPNDIFILKNVNISNTQNVFDKPLISIISSHVSLNALNFISNIISNSQLISFEKSNGIILACNFKINHFPKDNMIIISDSNLKIQDSSFINNKINKSLINTISSDIYLTGSIFENNNSEDDGCVMRVNNGDLNSVQIISNMFQFNNAKGSGGALYLIGKNIILENNKFIENSAGIGGAIRYQKYVPIFMKKQDKVGIKRNLVQDTCGTYFNNDCQQNKAHIFGQNICSNPRNGSLKYLNQTIYLKDKYKEINNIRSGENSETLQIILFDENGDQVKFPSSFDNFSQNLQKELQNYTAQIQIRERSNFISEQQISIQGTTIKEYGLDGFNFTQFTINGIPGNQSKILLQVSCIFKMREDQNEIDLNNKENFDIVMKFRNCLEGEVINQICSNCQMLECKECQEGYYSLIKPTYSNQNQQCKKCSPENTEGCYLNQIILKKATTEIQIYLCQGYWRESKYSDDIVECSNSRLSCEGIPEKNYCIEGKMGPLCEVCDLKGEQWGKPYGRSYFDDYRCEVCKNTADIALHTLFASIFILYTAYTIIQVVKQSNHRILCYYMRKIGILQAGRIGFIGQNTQYFKLLIHQLQLLVNLKVFRLEVISNILNQLIICITYTNLFDEIQLKVMLKMKKDMKYFQKLIFVNFYITSLDYYTKLNSNILLFITNQLINISSNIIMIINVLEVIFYNILFNIKQIQSFNSYSQPISVPIVASASSIDCYLHLILNDFPHYAFKLMFSLIFISFSFFISTLIYRLYAYYQAIKNDHKNYKAWYINYSFQISLIFYMFINQQGLIDALIKIASCRKIAGKSYIQSQISELCYTEQHMRMLFIFILPILIISIIIWPLYVIIKLKRNKEVIESSYPIIKIFGFLYFGYKKEYFYWEFVKIYERILIVLVVNYAQPFDQLSQNYLGMLILLILLAYSYFFISVQPYRDRHMNLIELFSSKLITLIFLLANIYNNASGVSKTIVIVFLCSLIAIQISTLIWSVISNSLIANQDAIVKMFFFKFISNIFKKHIEINGHYYLKLKHYSPTLFKMIYMPQTLNSFNKFILWKKVQKSLKTILMIEFRMKQKIDNKQEKKYVDCMCKNSKQLITGQEQGIFSFLLISDLQLFFQNKRNPCNIAIKMDPEKQKNKKNESDRVSVDRQSTNVFDEYFSSIKDEVNPNLNSIRNSKIGPNSKLTFEQQNKLILQSGHNILISSPTSMRQYPEACDDWFLLSKQNSKNE